MSSGRASRTGDTADRGVGRGIRDHWGRSLELRDHQRFPGSFPLLTQSPLYNQYINDKPSYDCPTLKTLLKMCQITPSHKKVFVSIGPGSPSKGDQTILSGGREKRTLVTKEGLFFAPDTVRGTPLRLIFHFVS